MKKNSFFMLLLFGLILFVSSCSSSGSSTSTDEDEKKVNLTFKKIPKKVEGKDAWLLLVKDEEIVNNGEAYGHAKALLDSCIKAETSEDIVDIVVIATADTNWFPEDYPEMPSEDFDSRYAKLNDFDNFGIDLKIEDLVQLSELETITTIIPDTGDEPETIWTKEGNIDTDSKKFTVDCGNAQKVAIVYEEATNSDFTADIQVSVFKQDETTPYLIYGKDKEFLDKDNSEFGNEKEIILDQGESSIVIEVELSETNPVSGSFKLYVIDTTGK